MYFFEANQIWTIICIPSHMLALKGKSGLSFFIFVSKPVADTGYLCTKVD